MPVTIRPLPRLMVSFGGFLRALVESRFFAQRKMVELRSSPKETISLRPSQAYYPLPSPL